MRQRFRSARRRKAVAGTGSTSWWSNMRDASPTRCESATPSARSLRPQRMTPRAGSVAESAPIIDDLARAPSNCHDAIGTRHGDGHLFDGTGESRREKTYVSHELPHDGVLGAFSIRGVDDRTVDFTMLLATAPMNSSAGHSHISKAAPSYARDTECSARIAISLNRKSGMRCGRRRAPMSIEDAIGTRLRAHS